LFKKYTFTIIVAVFSLMLIFSGTSSARLPSETTNKKSILTVEEQQWLREHGTLIYGADNHAPPLRYVDQADLQYKGVVVDYINLLSLELGVNIETHPLLWEDALEHLREGTTDICDMFASKERSKHFIFTDPIYNLRAVLMVMSDSREFASIEDMTLATQKGDYVNEYLLEQPLYENEVV